MATFRHAEIRLGRALVRADVGGTISSVLGGWEGFLSPPNNTGLTVGKSYTLVLCRSPVRIVVTSEAGPDGSVPFVAR